jgi:hypothetical protein
MLHHILANSNSVSLNDAQANAHCINGNVHSSTKSTMVLLWTELIHRHSTEKENHNRHSRNMNEPGTGGSRL